jgi:glycosyltransferase involved in cell wall biosynthesis
MIARRLSGDQPSGSRSDTWAIGAPSDARRRHGVRRHPANGRDRLLARRATLLPTLLDSLAAQTQLPEQLVLVDDGSPDASHEIAERFAHERAWVRALALARRPKAGDRLADAGELRAFLAGVACLEEPWDVVVKLDADLQLNPELFQAAAQRFAADPRLGITGSYLSASGGTAAYSGNTAPSTTCSDRTSSTGEPASSRSLRCRRSWLGHNRRSPRQAAWMANDELRARLGGERAPTSDGRP